MEKLIEGAGKLGIEFNARQVKQFELYYQELIEWNKKVNLTRKHARSRTLRLSTAKSCWKTTSPA